MLTSRRANHAVSVLAILWASAASAVPVGYSIVATVPDFSGTPAADVTTLISPATQISGHIGWDPETISPTGSDNCSIGADYGCFFASNIDPEFQSSPTSLQFLDGQLDKIIGWGYTSSSASTGLTLLDLSTPTPVAEASCSDILLQTLCGGATNMYTESVPIAFSLQPEVLLTFTFTASTPDFSATPAFELTTQIAAEGGVTGMLGWAPSLISSTGFDLCSIGADFGCYFMSNIDAVFASSPTSLQFLDGQLDKIIGWGFTNGSASTGLTLLDLSTPTPVAEANCSDILLQTLCGGATNFFSVSAEITFSLVPKLPSSNQVPEPASLGLVLAGLAGVLIARRRGLRRPAERTEADRRRHLSAALVPTLPL
jgi:hypothetical protein